jgi:hypothetical protein
MTGQLLNDDIPAGKVEAILKQTKSGPRLLLDNGREVVFSSAALYDQPERTPLAVGDRVEKHHESCVYFVNGRAITDVSWVLRRWLMPVHMLIPLLTYMLIGTIYACTYGHTPLGDCVWSVADPKRPHRPRTRAGLIIAVFLSWFLAAGLATALFGCMGGCLSGIGALAR